MEHLNPPDFLVYGKLSAIGIIALESKEDPFIKFINTIARLQRFIYWSVN
jgi:hypothetical protein